MIKYKVIKENFKSCELGKYTSYGIFAYSEEVHSALKFYPDVFLNKASAEQLVNLCNNNSLDIVHLIDVIEDAII